MDNCEIKNQDLIRLAPGTFLNDTMMNFFIKLITTYMFKKESSRNFHVFNTYFWSALEDHILKVNQQTKHRVTMQRVVSENYPALLSKVDIFDTVPQKRRSILKEISNYSSPSV